MTRVDWCAPRQVGVGRVEWLGVKSDWTPLEKEMVKRHGGTTEADFKAYGTVAGSIGGGIAGGLLCAPSVVGAAFCAGAGSIIGGIIGGEIGTIVGEQYKILVGKSDEEALADAWNNAVEEAKKAARGVLAVKAYLTMRDYALYLGYTEADLVKKGLPAAPIRTRWKPSAARYAQAQKNYAYVQNGGGQKSNDCSIKKDIGIPDSKISCPDFIYMTFWRGSRGPVSPPSASIDWYAVGRDEVTNSSIGSFGSGVTCDNLFPTLQKGIWLDTDVSCTSDKPSDIARDYISTINALPKVKASKGLPPVVSGGGGGTSPVVVLGGLAAVAAAVWYFFL